MKQGCNLRIQAAMASRPEQKFTPAQLARASGFDAVACGKHLHQMIKFDLASRELRPDGRGYLYFLSEVQLERFRERMEELRIVVDMAECRAAFCLPTDTWDIHDRLTFLQNVKERTVIGENPMLSKVIEDYQRTLRLREALEARRQ